MPTLDQVSFSPIRKLFLPIDISPWFSPYGGSRAFNVLDSFLGTPDIVTKVMLNNKMR